MIGDRDLDKYCVLIYVKPKSKISNELLENDLLIYFIRVVLVKSF